MNKEHPPIYYPVMLNLAGKSTLIVGGGKVARRKVDALLTAAAKVMVIAPDLLTMPAEVSCQQREYQAADCDGHFLIIAATNNPLLNTKVAADARERNILHNVVDDPTAGSLIIPAVVQRGALQIAISTSGSSPTLSSIIKAEIAEKYGSEYRLLTDLLWQLRQEYDDIMTAAKMSDDARRLCWRKVLKYPLLAMLATGEDAETAARNLLNSIISQVNEL